MLITDVAYQSETRERNIAIGAHCQGANPDRIKVVKGWPGEDSESFHEKISDVDLAGE